MSDDDRDETRESKALPAKLVEDPDQIAELEARNSLDQFSEVQWLISEATAPDGDFRLRPSTLLDLNRTVTSGIERYAGSYRPHEMTITNSAHVPPPLSRVPRLVEDMCDYVNSRWQAKDALHLSAYVMWRANWIHPFDDGNGRTARAASYLVLCARLGYPLPGARTIPEQIIANKKPYWGALEAADRVWRDDERVDVGDLEKYLEKLLVPRSGDS